MKNNWQVATAAEAFCAAQFSRMGWDVSVQYGANQPEYDLVAVDGERVLKVQVKGSNDGSWGLTQAYIKDANYHKAADDWITQYSRLTIFCLVQFKNISLECLPRMYLARPIEIANWLKAAAAGRGDTVLYERHEWTQRAQAAGTIDLIPENWIFGKERLEEIANLTIAST